MIRIHSFVSGSDYVELNWIHPKFLPEKYRLKYFCTVNSTSNPNQTKNDFIIENSQNLSSDTTDVRISELRPSSICVLFLLAVYNPASIDSGIAIRGMTSCENSSKKNLFRSFHNISHLLQTTANINKCVTCRRKSRIPVKNNNSVYIHVYCREGLIPF